MKLELELELELKLELELELELKFEVKAIFKVRGNLEFFEDVCWNKKRRKGKNEKRQNENDQYKTS